MRVLLITSPEEDYLQDSIIHGFKKKMGKDALDFPVKNILYDDCKDLEKIRGNGFTLYGLLPASLKNNSVINLENTIQKNEFDLFVFTSIYRQYEIFYHYAEMLIKSKANVWLMDGEDSPVIFPYLSKHLKKFYNAIKPHKYFIYFKRELTNETINSIYFRMPMHKIGKVAIPKNIKPVSFSIPEEKIIESLPGKHQLFASHIVDEEVAEKYSGSKHQRLFDKEDEYYKDLQQSRFGITTKRAGWDCLRHYEIAANGAVICFKNLYEKPANCAPHGLEDGKNCIAYTDYDNLMDKVCNMSEEAYNELLKNSLDWIKNRTSSQKVSFLLKNFYEANRSSR
ncbi:MAG: glycosyltransferase family 1 protein [Bacteroidetes bacterium]|nr:glycosyltransferase family 1 protein [Bacteroidota bacterium]